MFPFWILLKLRMTVVVVTTGAVRQIVIAYKPTPSLFTGQMPFLSPN